LIERIAMTSVVFGPSTKGGFGKTGSSGFGNVAGALPADVSRARICRPVRTSSTAGGTSRDYAHLAITFCRCMNIPARYCTGYLGDIGMPPPYAAGDFAGWFEAYIGGRWYTFDARNNIPRIGRVLIAQGRDAADVPITQTFGPNTLVSFKVWTDEVV
jgi:transglutaminase-like putative cysteine protease